MPGVGDAVRAGWPGRHTERGVEATWGFFGTINDGNG
jgi:hypothetical protein